MDNFSTTPNLLHPSDCEGGSSLTKEGRSTSIPKYIGMVEEDELEVFVDVLDDKFGPNSPTPLGAMGDRALTLFPSFVWHSHNQSNANVETLLLEGGAHQETSKVMSVWGMKSST